MGGVLGLPTTDISSGKNYLKF